MEYSFDIFQLWNVAAGQIILILAGIILILLDICLIERGQEQKNCILGWFTVITFILTLLHLMDRTWNLHEIVFMGVFSADKFSIFISIIVLLSGLLSALMGIGYLRNNQTIKGEFYILLIFAVAGTICMVQSVDLLMMFIGLEIMSLAVYTLAAFLKQDRFSLEGGIKYFLLGSFASAFFLFGIALLYGLTASVNITQIATALSHDLYSQKMVLLALAMIMGGLFFKIALVPFHVWTPDAYQGAPAVVTGFMASAVKAGAIGAFVKILFVAFSPMLSMSGQPDFLSTANLSAIGAYWKPVVWWLSLLTMFFGNLLAISQHNIKRMLAYSSIAHAGYIFIGVIAANDDGRMGILFYLFSYTLMTVGAFGVIYLIDGRERHAQELEDYRGLAYRYPALAFLLSLFMVAMAGLPPTAGFIGKFYLFAAAIKEGYYVLAALGILTSVIGAYYYLRVIYMMYMKEEVREVVRGPVAAPTVLALLVAALGVIYFGILPSGLTQAALAAQQSLAMIF